MIPIISSVPMTMFIVTNIEIIIPSMFFILMLRFGHRSFFTSSTVFRSVSVRFSGSISIFNTHSSRSSIGLSSRSMLISNTSRSMFVFSSSPIISGLIIILIKIRFNISFFRSPTRCFTIMSIRYSSSFTPTISSTRSIVITLSMIRPIISCSMSITFRVSIVSPVISNIMNMIFMGGS